MHVPVPPAGSGSSSTLKSRAPSLVRKGRWAGALLGLLLAAAPVAAQAAGPAYRATQFACARFAERRSSEVETETGTRRGSARIAREGELRLAGIPRGGAVALVAWFETLRVWRVTGADSLVPDTDGVLGGRFRGTLEADGRYVPRARPFVPEGVREAWDLGAALDVLLPPLPPRALQVGEAWRAGDSLAIRRLADSASLQRYRVERRVAGRVEPAAGDTLTPPFERSVDERANVAWHAADGVVRYERRAVVEVLVPAGGAVKRPVRSRVDERSLLTREGAEPAACGTLGPADFE